MQLYEPLAELSHVKSNSESQDNDWLSHGNETAIFPFTKTPPTINFKLLPTSRRAPLSGPLIDNTRHYSPAIHSTHITTYYISKGFCSDFRPPRMYHCSKHHCLAITKLRQRHRGSSRLPLLSYETIRDKGGIRTTMT